MPNQCHLCCSSFSEEQTKVIVWWLLAFLVAVCNINLCQKFVTEPPFLVLCLPPVLGGSFLALFLTGVAFNLEEDQPLNWFRFRGADANNNEETSLEAPLIRSETDNSTAYRQQESRLVNDHRLYFVDNMRIVLVGVVVTWHSVGQALAVFAATTETTALHIKPLHTSLKLLLLWIELCIPVMMPGFFAIAGYVTPSSFDKNGKKTFLRNKRNRLWIPAAVTTFTIVPAFTMWNQRFGILRTQLGLKTPVFYFPWTGHCWFLFTLLVFQWMYCNLQTDSSSTRQTDHEDTYMDRPETAENRSVSAIPFPSIWVRLTLGFGVSGVVKSLGDLLIPTTNGLNLHDWPRHFLLFWAGVYSFRNGWLRPEELAVNVPLASAGILVCLLTLLSCCHVFLPLNDDDIDNNRSILELAIVWVGGMASLDVTLAIVYAFQVYANVPWSSFWKTSAYAVYLVHLLVLHVVCDTAANAMLERPQGTSELILEGTEGGSAEPLFTLHQQWFGLVVVVSATHLVSWPTAWILVQLPGFRNFL